MLEFIFFAKCLSTICEPASNVISNVKVQMPNEIPMLECQSFMSFELLGDQSVESIEPERAELARQSPFVIWNLAFI